jgi:tetratricopeptide (TPR) repeat protein
MGFVSENIRPVSDPHNFLLRSWISWGLPGLVILVLFLSLWVRKTIEVFTVAGWRNTPGGYAGLVFGSMAFLLHSFMDMDFFIPETALFGWCALGGALGVAALQERPDRRTTPPLAGYRMAAGGIALVMVLPAFLFLQAESVAFRGNKAVEEGEYSEAAVYYSRARTLIPFSGKFALEEGRARLSSGERESALELFERARSLMRASPYPSWELGRAAQYAGDWKGSLTHLTTALDRYPTSPRIRIDLARAHLNLGQRAQAIRQLEDARRVAVFDPEAKSLIDRVLAEAGL